jgi:hypothetical protein
LAHLEGGIKLLITDCAGTLSPFRWHLDGRAAGFFVGVYRSELGTSLVSGQRILIRAGADRRSTLMPWMKT